MTSEGDQHADPAPRGGGPDGDFAGKRVLVGVCGGIAAYKSAMLVSRLVQSGASVSVLMTEAATQFVTPLTFQALSGRPVYTSPWQHIEASERWPALLSGPSRRCAAGG